MTRRSFSDMTLNDLFKIRDSFVMLEHHGIVEKAMTHTYPSVLQEIDARYLKDLVPNE